MVSALAPERAVRVRALTGDFTFPMIGHIIPLLLVYVKVCLSVCVIDCFLLLLSFFVTWPLERVNCLK